MLRERDVRRVITVSLSAVMERAHPVCAWRVSTCAVVMRAVNALLDCLSANSKGTVVMVRKERFYCAKSYHIPRHCLLIQCSQLRWDNWRYKAASSRQRAASSRQQTAGSRQQAAGSRQQAAASCDRIIGVTRQSRSRSWNHGEAVLRLPVERWDQFCYAGPCEE
jgi:hypothetical protein